jgi:hypothetical protein
MPPVFNVSAFNFLAAGNFKGWLTGCGQTLSVTGKGTSSTLELHDAKQSKAVQVMISKEQKFNLCIDLKFYLPEPIISIF